MGKFGTEIVQQMSRIYHGKGGIEFGKNLSPLCHCLGEYDPKKSFIWAPETQT